MKYVILILYPIFISIPVFSQEETAEELPPVFTDRSSQTDAVGLIPKGRFQIESGFFYLTDNEDDQDFLAFPNLFLKYGISDRLEFRLILNYFNQKTGSPTGDIKESGIAPIGIGFKVALLPEQKRVIPKITYGLTLIIPKIGDSAFITDELTASMRFLFENSISDIFTLDYSLGFDWEDTGNASGFYTLMGSFSITDRFGGYVEIFSRYDEIIKDPWGFDTGISYLINDHLVVDGTVGFGLNNIATDLFFNVGVGWKVDFSH